MSGMHVIKTSKGTFASFLCDFGQTGSESETIEPLESIPEDLFEQITTSQWSFLDRVSSEINPLDHHFAGLVLDVVGDMYPETESVGNTKSKLVSMLSSAWQYVSSGFAKLGIAMATTFSRMSFKLCPGDRTMIASLDIQLPKAMGGFCKQGLIGVKRKYDAAAHTFFGPSMLQNTLSLAVEW
eukprot:CAMPEP_0184292660 /NCGR_PEP_ID=MMETSP1049-20130417/4385_1 /TAXON_ID=77928 /ORGANISM="Proteomonas sulcata, Strain CCMP704" /LENGTH=182 /DNA_ID=CAMNT_0026600505 /DNA_START=266 /DNA_END=811 /DNA_ORIENTATION=-